MVTVPVGVVEPPVTVTVTFTVPPVADGSGVSDVMVTVEGGNPTVWGSVSLLPRNKGVSGVYVAVRVLDPSELKTTAQLPVPPERVMEQFVFAPVMATVPVGVDELVTATLTVTDCPTSDWSGESDVIVVTVTPGGMMV